MRTPKFKVGDRVRLVRGPSCMGAPTGAEGTVDENDAVPFVRWDCGIRDANHEDFLEPITNDTMSDELKVTKAAVLQAASKCSTAKATLQVLFPEAFKPSDEPFEFEREHELTLNNCTEVPLYIGNAFAPSGLEGKCLIINKGWEMRKQEHEGRTILTFHRKP